MTDWYRSLNADCFECPHFTGYPCLDGCVNDWINQNMERAKGESMNVYEVRVKMVSSAVVSVEADGPGHAIRKAMKNLLDGVEVCIDDTLVDDCSWPCFDVQSVSNLSELHPVDELPFA